MSDRALNVQDLEAMPRGDGGLELVAGCHRRGVRARYADGVLALSCVQCDRLVTRVAVAGRPTEFLVAKPVVP